MKSSTPISASLVRLVFAAMLILLSVGTLTAPAVSIKEYQVTTPASNPWGISQGPDGALWFAERDVDIIGRISTTGVITEFSLPEKCEPNFITAGADGSLWFTEYLVDKIGRLTPAGVFTAFRLTAGAKPFGIASGPDGNLWFTEYGANKIGRIDPSGTTITEFDITPFTANSQPFGITVGADSNLWFSEFNGNKIGRITTAGVITEFVVGLGSNPRLLTAGADGNVWFTQGSDNRIGRITPTGTITRFVIPTAGADNFGITAGADGSVWFCERSANQLGRITPAGLVTEFPIPTPASGPYGIALGPNGALWFTEQNQNQIGTRANPVAFYALSPCRVLDTRDLAGPLGGPALVASATRVFPFAGACAIPATARGVSANVTVVGPGASSDLRIVAGDQPTPTGTAINFSAGKTMANNAIVGLSNSASQSVAVKNDAAASVNVIIDVNGYFQ